MELGGPREAPYGPGRTERFGAHGSEMFTWLRSRVELMDKGIVIKLSLVVALASEKCGFFDME
jgi:hypothetical protein